MSSWQLVFIPSLILIGCRPNPPRAHRLPLAAQPACASAAIGDWSGEATRPPLPPVFVLDTGPAAWVPESAGYSRLTPDWTGTEPPRFPAGWRWTSSDSVELFWSTGYIGVRLVVAGLGDTLRGRATTFGNEHSTPPEAPVHAAAMVVAAPCSRVGESRPRPRVVVNSLDESRGEWAPPLFPGSSINVPATVAEDWLTSLQIGSERILFEETELDSVARRLDIGPIGQGGDAASFVEWLCFTGGAEQDRWALWLEAGEMDGSTVGQVQMVSLSPDAHLDHRCNQLPAALSLALPKGLTVGLMDSAVHRLLGPPSGAVGDTSIYSYVREPPAKDAVMNRVVLVTERGRVVQVAAWRSSAF